MTDEGDLRRHPGFPVVPRVPRHISRVSGPGHHQLSVIGCAMVTVSSIAVTLWLSVTRASKRWDAKASFDGRRHVEG